MKRFLLILLVVIVFAAIGGYFFVNNGYTHNYDEEYPIKELTITPDSAMIAHGRYLALGPAHCQHCHSPLENIQDVEMGKEVPMTGGFVFELPIGNIHSPNITSDVETGIGGYSDGQLYRMLRHNIRHDGQVCLELMPFFNMTEYDVKSVISYLRTLAPARNERIEHEYNFLGKAARTFAIKPSNSASTPLEHIKRDSTIEYGKYLSEAVANCYGCHTERDLKTGAFVGEPYAGGTIFGPDASTQNWKFVTPNITTDPETGVIAAWKEEHFIARMRGGRVHMTSPMPWGPFSRLEDADLKAIYRFLQTVKPVKRDNGQIITPPADA